MVAVQVDRVSNWVTGAVRVHQEHLDHLGKGKVYIGRKGKGMTKVKVKVGEANATWLSGA